jgi:hypothetical protein
MRVMSPGTYVVVLLLGAFALAVWIDIRWPQLTPKELRWALIHTAASVILAQFVVAAGIKIGQGSPSLMLAMIVTLIVPSLVYCLVSGVWVMKVAQAAISRYRH